MKWKKNDIFIYYFNSKQKQKNKNEKNIKYISHA